MERGIRMQMWLRTKVGEEQNEFKNTAEIFKNVITGKREKMSSICSENKSVKREL